MKRITLSIAILFFTLFTFAQNGQAPLAKDQKQINFGISGSGSSIPVYFGMDWGGVLHKDITAGFVLRANIENFDWLGVYGVGDYHFNSLLGISPEFDLYAGLNAGFRMWYNNGNDKTNGLHWDIHIGGRWFWNDKWGLNVEFGGGDGVGGRLGVTRKM